MHNAGTSQFTSDGTNRSKNSKNLTTPACQTIRVVMSPNGQNAPPALAATTTLTQAGTRKRGLSRPTLTTTAPMTSAVVRLSSDEDRKNAARPVTQKIIR